MGVRLGLEGYAKVKAAARYAGISERTFRDWLKLGLPHFRLGSGTILVAYGDIDQWLEKYKVDGNEIDTVVEQVMKGL